MESVYKPQDVEPQWAKTWLERKVFHADENSKKKPFSMVIPPPNITGSLHMGHALNNTIQDILNRWYRMRGYETCWFPGTDHAGIATQVVVERELRKEGKTRYDLGREEFIKRVWKWREQYGGIIDEQLKKLGVSCDWDRYSFTMDEKRSRAVVEAFVRLHEKGVIYRDRYIVNWCPKCQTALSDLEVEHPENEAPGTLYYLKYPLENSAGESVTIATVRPETILADVAVAVHPTDARYKKLIGRFALLPLVGRRLPIIADEWADPAVGSGAVKITPAHDPNDFEVGRRHKLPVSQVIGLDGKMKLDEIFADSTIAAKNKEAIRKYDHLDRFECRKMIVEDLKQAGYLVKEEPWASNPGRCARSGDVIEPYLSVQWFARMKNLARPALDAVKSGQTRFFPERFSKLYFDWMENIRDWCISRQLWWGHQIPAWYCVKCSKNELLKSAANQYTILQGAKPIVAREKPASCPKCQESDLVQEPDVLDTWFSSGLWPLSVMGWPDETRDLDYFYPTSVLSTGRDIIFLWVARMIMTGLQFKKEVPFRHVYIHPTILDREGRRMSKSKGTGVDPLDLITKYGADATRYGMILICQGQDVRFNQEKIEQARNFANKLWNAARYILSSAGAETTLKMGTVQGTGPQFSSGLSPFSDPALTFYDRWILFKLSGTIRSVTTELENYEFASAATLLYEFVWDDYCDWYLELSKLDLQGDNKERRGIVTAILFHVLSTILKLLHPFIPFVTEEIWDQLSPKSTLLLNESWPTLDKEFPSEPVPSMEIFMETVKAVRNLRAEIGLKPKDRSPLVIRTEEKGLFEEMQREVIFLAQASTLSVINENVPAPKKALSAHVSQGSVFLPLEGLVDIGAELKRLENDRQKSLSELESARKLLNDPAFSDKAKPEVIEKTKEKERLLREKMERVQERIARLK